MANITGKVWGNTSALIQTPLVELHRINIKAGYKCSEHKHEHKWNGFYVISGTLEIHVRKNNYELTDVTVLRAGDFTTVRPGEYHWFSSITDCVALELYYPETLSEDIVRKSVGGRDISAPHETKSPCTKVCTLDPLTGKCFGCGRTAEEIRIHGLNHAKTLYEGYDK
jgi:mannose-6-phosphate isomerase-like protein (cupin superfamily)